MAEPSQSQHQQVTFAAALPHGGYQAFARGQVYKLIGLAEVVGSSTCYWGIDDNGNTQLLPVGEVKITDPQALPIGHETLRNSLSGSTGQSESMRSRTPAGSSSR